MLKHFQENNHPSEGPEQPKSGQPEARYTHRNWQQSPEGGSWSPGQGQAGPNPGPGSFPPPAPPRYSYRTSKKKRPVLPVLLSILLTFVLTASLTWGLSVQGVLPGTRPVSDEMVKNAAEIEGLGLSLHSDDPKAKAAAEKLADIIGLLQNNYYRVLSDSELIEAMSEGVANAMDSKYTYYQSPEEFQSFHDSMAGNYSGIGATVSLREDGAFELISIAEDGPASKAGLLAGDIVTAVDGKDVTAYKTPAQLAADVKGEDGTQVKLTIYRDGESMDFSVIRGRVQVKHVRWRMLDDKTGYLYMSEFAETVPEQFKAGLKDLLKEGAEQIVFDMRGNPGGSKDAVVSCLDMLLPEAVIATARGRYGGKPYTDVWKSSAGSLIPEDMPLAVLINGGTASAAELFSGCLRDYDRAVLIGEKSYGKGSGMNTWSLSDHSAVTITTFNYYLPKGDMIEGDGLEPHIKAEPVSKEYRRVLQYELTPEQDPGLKAALDYFAKQAGSGSKAA